MEKKTLTKALAFPTVFKTEWIRIVLSRIHDGAFWLETSPVKFSKKTINRVTGFQTLDQPETLRSDKKEAIEKNTRAKWNNRGITIDTIKDLEIANAYEKLCIDEKLKDEFVIGENKNLDKRPIFPYGIQD